MARANARGISSIGKKAGDFSALKIDGSPQFHFFVSQNRERQLVPILVSLVISINLPQS